MTNNIMAKALKYRALCSCGWVSSWATNDVFARCMGEVHVDACVDVDDDVEHQVHVSWGEWS